MDGDEQALKDIAEWSTRDLRDRFAMAAMPDVQRRTNVTDGGTEFAAKVIAGACYIIADAMMKAREPKEAK